MNERMKIKCLSENGLYFYTLPGAPTLFLPPHLLASCRLWKVRVGKLANSASSSPEAWAFPLR